MSCFISLITAGVGSIVDQPGFFDLSDGLQDPSAKGDDLERIAGLVDFGQFRPELERAEPRSDGRKGARPAFERVLMFKTLLLQAMQGLSDERCEYLIKDRLSFMRFLGLGLADPVPDANTIWTFRGALKRARAVDALFTRLDTALRASGYLAMGGQIVDATIVAAPKPRITEGERAAIKAIARLIGAILLETSDDWATQRARCMTLETISNVSDNPTVSLAAVAG